MKLLLDTHVAIWALGHTKGLPEEIRGIISDPANDVYVSAVSVWEIAIKHAGARRDPMPFSGGEAVRHFRQAGFLFLNVTPEHAACVERLPPLHGDPFDRLLVAQALAEPLRLVTHDRKVAAYSDSITAF